MVAFPFPLDAVFLEPIKDVDLRIYARARNPKASLESLAEVIAILASGVSRGLLEPLSTFNYPIAQINDNDLSPGELRLSLRLSNTSAATYRCMLNLMAHSHYDHQPMASVKIASTSVHELSKIGVEDVLVRPCSLESTRHVFSTEIASNVWTADGGYIAFRIEFAKALSKGNLDELIEGLADCDSFGVLGAFADSRDPEKEITLITGGTRLINDYVVEHRIVEFDGNRSAIAAYLNMLSWFHAAVHPVKGVRIQLIDI